jgi:pimeloyl-ACP methyl ester carboxylesterase
MREWNVFIPANGEHLAATITAPDGRPRGVVTLSTGIGVMRSHRFQMWARTAERLAERGIASVRWEYRGMHDSTGWEWQPALAADWLDQLQAIVAFTRQALGTAPTVAAGNCVGATLSLRLAATDPECVGVIGVLPPFEEPGELEAKLRTLAVFRLLDRLSSFPGRRLLRAAFRRRRAKGLGQGLLPLALTRADVLFLFGMETDGTVDMPPGLRMAVDRLPPRERAKLEIEILPEPKLDRFTSVQGQQMVLGAMVDWIDHRLPDREPESGIAEGGESRVGWTDVHIG